MNDILNSAPHRRYNILTGEWILVSPHRTKRPWQGKTESTSKENRPDYVPDCYLCPGNTRSSGEVNPDYKNPYTFYNDFPALMPQGPDENISIGLLKAESETGICKVVCFSPDHSLTLALMKIEDIIKVGQTLKQEYRELGEQKESTMCKSLRIREMLWGAATPTPTGRSGLRSQYPTKS